MGQKADPRILLMHAIGANVARVISTAVVAAIVIWHINLTNIPIILAILALGINI